MENWKNKSGRWKWGYVVIVENNFHSYGNVRYLPFTLGIRRKANMHVQFSWESTISGNAFSKLVPNMEMWYSQVDFPGNHFWYLETNTTYMVIMIIQRMKILKVKVILTIDFLLNELKKLKYTTIAWAASLSVNKL